MSFLHTKSFHVENILKTLLLVVFAYYLYYVIDSGEILLYLHPRLIVFLYLSIGFMLLLALGSIRNVYKIPRKKMHPITYTLFIIPLLLAILVPPRPIDSHSLAGRRIQQGMGVGIELRGDEPSDGSFPVHESITLDERTFSPWFYELYRDPYSYQENTIQVRGFIHHEEGLGEEEFYITRFLMVCCVADMQLAGLMASHSSASLYSQDEWVELRGTLSAYEYKGRTLPYIIGEEIIRIERPEVPYVYPYLFLPED